MIYSWVDEYGATHYSQNPMDFPENAEGAGVGSYPDTRPSTDEKKSHEKRMESTHQFSNERDPARSEDVANYDRSSKRYEKQMT